MVKFDPRTRSISRCTKLFSMRAIGSPENATLHAPRTRYVFLKNGMARADRRLAVTAPGGGRPSIHNHYRDKSLI